ncbi:MAG: glycosyltransferase family 2 protein [Candidatus Omnitrophica bacterium]|nr:glycosyltransferase family 2 protein [Candidatus Omnitrophota bacterium]
MAAQIPISVVIIAKNEEGHIAGCIESALWAGEVLVVDDFSADSTVAVAKRLGARVLQRRMDIEGTHRNWAYAHSSFDWVFSLDADERITDELRQDLEKTISREIEHKGYTVPIKTYIGDYWIRYGGWYPGRKLRFFDKNFFQYEEVEVHPRALLRGSCGHLDGDVIHYSYRGIADFVTSLNAQTTLEARKWVKDKRTIGVFSCLRKTCDRFLRTYIAKRGYKDGFVGFIVAVFGGLYQLLSYAKYRELFKDTDTQ